MIGRDGCCLVEGSSKQAARARLQLMMCHSRAIPLRDGLSHGPVIAAFEERLFDDGLTESGLERAHASPDF